MPKTKQLLSRATYRRVKQMDREQLSEYVTKVYLSGFEAGRKAGTPDVLMRTFREVLMSIDSIGPTRADAIMKKLGDTFALKETETDPTEIGGQRSDGHGRPEQRRPVDAEVQDGLEAPEEADQARGERRPSLLSSIPGTARPPEHSAPPVHEGHGRLHGRGGQRPRLPRLRAPIVNQWARGTNPTFCQGCGQAIDWTPEPESKEAEQ